MPAKYGKASADYLSQKGIKNFLYIEAGGMGHDQPKSIAYRAIQFFEDGKH